MTTNEGQDVRPPADDEENTSDESASTSKDGESWDPYVNYAVGPDEAGNVLMHAVGAIGAFIRAVKRRFSRSDD